LVGSGFPVLVDLARRTLAVRGRSIKLVPTWHSGIFDNDATRIVFQDELGDGFINTCSPAYGADRGADGVWLIEPDGLVKAGSYKPPRTQSDLEKCVAHSGGLVPVPGRFIIAQAWLEGGVSIVDLTDPAAPVELTWFDRPDYGRSMDYTAGIWSVYHYDGYLYASDMYEGLEVLRLTDPAFADAARYDDTGLNPQTQPSYASRFGTRSGVCNRCTLTTSTCRYGRRL
jgi:hypothetical protein